jgi:amino acid transporter
LQTGRGLTKILTIAALKEQLRMAATDHDPPIKPQLGFWDSVSIMVGIVIGTTIYEMPPDIAKNMTTPWGVIGVWALGGLLSLIGALCYAELASTYPRMGGDYVYLTRAFGPWLGFLFGWAQLAVILTASTGSMAFVFGRYGVKLWHLDAGAAVGFALAAVLIFSLLNIAGVVFGKGAQNILSATKIIGLAAILLAGFLKGQSGTFAIDERPMTGFGGFGLAMIFVLYGYGGWNDMAFVAADLRNRKDIVRSLLIGTAAITLFYLLVNAAYIVGLGYDNLRKSEAVASDVLHLLLGDFGASAMAILVMISALGAVNGLIFAGTRVYASLGAEHSVFAWLGRWNPRLGSPIGALVAQAAITLGMIFVVGTDAGRAAIDQLWAAFGWKAIAWGKFGGGFAMLVSATAPVFWTFFLLTGISLFVLRIKDRGIERPFSLPVPLFPVLPLVFCGTCVYMLYSSVKWAEELSLIGVVPLAAGVPLYFVSKRQPAAADEPLADMPAPEPTVPTLE